MIIDSHVHIGQFYDRYYSPTFVSKLMTSVGAAYYAVSSTTMCDEDYTKVLSEIKELISLDGERVLPIMWITPYGLKGSIAWFLDSGIRWRCLKVHPFLHKNDWEPGGLQFREVIDIARELNVPLLIHTGQDKCCLCGKYEQMIAENTDINFILAHGQPIQQVIPILGRYENAYADSAFMSIGQMREIIDNKLANKLLWGTDVCIPLYFHPHMNLVKHYGRKLKSFRKVCTQEQYVAVTITNAGKLFDVAL